MKTLKKIKEFFAGDTGVAKDIFLAILGIVGFYVMLVLASWADAKFSLTEAYNLVDIASLSLKVFTGSALAWILKRIVFSHTLGKDFGKTFNEGWDSMTSQEKAKWIIISFLVIFGSIMFAA